MANYQDNNIIYTKVTRPSILTGGRISKGRYVLDENGYVSSKEGAVVNMIDVDWNGAQLDNGLVINSTGDMLTRLNDTYTKSEINDITDSFGDNLDELSSKVNNLDVYSKDESDEKYQPKGDYLTEHQDISSKANVSDVYSKTEADETFQPKGDYLTEHQDISGKANVDDVYSKTEADETFQPKGDYLTEHQSLSDYATKLFVNQRISDLVGEAPEAFDTLKEIADKLSNNDDTVSTLISQIADKANISDVYSKTEADETFQPKGDYLTEHQDISGKANVSDVYSKTEADETFQSKGDYLTEHQDISGKANVSDVYSKTEADETFQPKGDYLTEHQDISDKANVSDVYSKTEADETFQPKGDYLTEHQDISGKANVSDVYSKTEADETFQPKGDYLTEHQDISGKANVSDVYTKSELDENLNNINFALTTGIESLSDRIDNLDFYDKETSDNKYQPKGDYLTEHQSLEGYATETYVDTKISDLVGTAPEAFDTLKEIADKLTDNDDVVSALTLEISNKANTTDVYNKTEADETFQPKGDYLTEHQDISGKANVSDVYSKNEADETFQPKGDYLTEHQSLEGYATETYVDNAIESIVGAAPENFDTLKELADVMGDLKVIDQEAIPGVEGEKYTQEEIDAAQEGDDAYGKTTDDWKIEPVPAVDEISHNMTIGEFVEKSMETVNEKEELSKLQLKYNALLSLLNLRETDVNNVVINQELETSNNVTFDEPVDNIVIPETTSAYVVTAPLEDNATVTLTSNKYMTLDNTSEEPVSATVQRPAEAGESGTTGTTVYLVGQYDTLTLENVSPNVKSGRDAAVVNNVVITENNTKNLTLNLDLQDGATITNNSNTAITINDKNNEETVLAIVAPNSTVTLNGGTYITLDVAVSDNTLIIKKTAHIGTLNVTKGNVKVEVPRESDIANVIDNLNIAEGYTVDYLHDDITAANISKLTTTGTHTFQEDLTKSGNFSVGLFSSDDMIWNLNGHNLTSSNTRGYGIFTLRGTAQLEINDTIGTGVVKNTADEYGFWTSTVGSKVVINGGNFEAATHVLYAQKGTIEVNGGTFKLTNAATADKDQNGNFKFLLNCHDADYVSGDAQIIVRGGKFYGFDPSNTYGEPGGPVSYVPEGYESIPTNEAYEYGTVYEVRKIQLQN